MYEMQSDGAGEGYVEEDESSCPPPPKEVPAFGCKVPVCKSDKECTTSGHRCCFNGCVFTCMPTMPPPPSKLILVSHAAVQLLQNLYLKRTPQRICFLL